MKKLVMILLGVVFTAGVMAQVTPKKVEEKDLKNDIKEKKEIKHEQGKNLKKLKVGEAVENQEAANKQRREIHKHKKHLRKKGVRHPVKKAKEQIENEKKN